MMNWDLRCEATISMPPEGELVIPSLMTTQLGAMPCRPRRVVKQHGFVLC